MHSLHPYDIALYSNFYSVLNFPCSSHFAFSSTRKFCVWYMGNTHTIEFNLLLQRNFLLLIMKGCCYNLLNIYHITVVAHYISVNVHLGYDYLKVSTVHSDRSTDIQAI